MSTILGNPTVDGPKPEVVVQPFVEATPESVWWEMVHRLPVVASSATPESVWKEDNKEQ